MLGGEFQSLDSVGDWTGKTKDGIKVKFRFQKDGSVVWFGYDPESEREFPPGVRAKYSVRGKSPLWEIDFQDFEEACVKSLTIQGILQPLEKGKFKMEWPNCSRKRPGSFSEEAIIFTKTDP